MRDSHQAGVIEIKSSIGRKSDDAGAVRTRPMPTTRAAEAPTVSAKANGQDIIIIEQRSFVRECISYGLKNFFPGRIASFSSLANWLERSDQHNAKVILLSVPGRPGGNDLDEILETIAPNTNKVPVILLCDSDDPERIVTALKKGVRGYISTVFSLEVVAQALQLVMAGGVFVPANSLIAARQHEKHSSGAGIFNELFTARQAAVVEKLRVGKANKTIAYELNMCESTVKVHVRNIMKKLKAKNRTEVAFIANRLSSDIAGVRSDLDHWSPEKV